MSAPRIASLGRILADTVATASRWGIGAPASATADAAGPACAPGDPALPILLLHSQVAWDDVWQRPQEMALGLARDHNWPVVFFSPVQSHDARNRYRGRWQPRRIHPEAPSLAIECPLMLSGEYKNSVIRNINGRGIAAEAAAALRRHAAFRDADPRNLLFLANTPFHQDMIDALQPARGVVYDLIDDFVAFGWAPPEGRAREAELLRRADLLFTGTGTLLDTKTKGHPDAHFIGCGVDYRRFAAGPDEPEPEELRSLPRPILGYIGTLSDRLDRALLEALALRFPEASLVLIGPVHGSFGPPLTGRNIHNLGLRPASALAAYSARFDVALMPFAQTEAARAIHPVKTLEYLAAGCPTLSTPIPDVERYYAGIVEVAPAVEPFLARVAGLLAETPEQRAARRERGRAHAVHRTWAAMVSAMDTHLRRIVAAKSAAAPAAATGTRT